jgi:F-type H+-transporting ATPase subunit a
MSVIYQLFAMISGAIPVIGQFNIIGVIVAPFLHMYFDLFSGVMQTYLFSTLTVSFIGNELPSEVK